MTDTLAIHVDHISKRFGRLLKSPILAVQNLSLEVKQGEVFGFLGPNGAGKTTTIRMMMDLIRPNRGDVFMFGKHVRRERSVLSRVGAQVEDARFYPFLTGRRNLEVLCLTADMDRQVYRPRIEALLEQVGMAERSRRRVSGYSTGMKQRLGLAAALLGNPDLVILDEPTNGLDPQGIQEIRLFIRDLADKQGKTVFLSSHMLNEVEQVCDRVAIVNHGQLVETGTVNDILSREEQLKVEVDDIAKASAILGEHWTVNPTQTALLVNASRDDAPAIAEKLISNQVRLYELTKHRRSLEEYFLSVTSGEEQHVD